MSDVQKAALSPETVLAQMKKNGVTHVVWLPDSETNWLFLLMQEDPSLTLVGVNREGLAFSTASGIYAGGKTPLILTHPAAGNLPILQSQFELQS